MPDLGIPVFHSGSEVRKTGIRANSGHHVAGHPVTDAFPKRLIGIRQRRSQVRKRRRAHHAESGGCPKCGVGPGLVPHHGFQLGNAGNSVAAEKLESADGFVPSSFGSPGQEVDGVLVWRKHRQRVWRLVLNPFQKKGESLRADGLDSPDDLVESRRVPAALEFSFVARKPFGQRPAILAWLCTWLVVTCAKSNESNQSNQCRQARNDDEEYLRLSHWRMVWRNHPFSNVQKARH